jgi:hypothetical protein
MIPIPLTSGAYSSLSVIANAQRCVNLYPEANPKDTRPPVPVTHYPRAGKKLLAIPPTLGPGRGLYRATNGDLYANVDDFIYFVDSNFAFSQVINIGHGTSPVLMADNGQDVGDDLVAVDGSATGWQITMSTRVGAVIVDGTGLFVGANRVDYLQGFFLFNAPGTPYWYTSLLNSVSFNALDIASKASYADNIKTLGVRQREAWLIGELTTEPWYLSGAAQFPFEAVASTFVPYGCVATYSMCPIDVRLFWLSQDLKGQGIAVMTEGYEAKRISTYALENEWRKYSDITDAIGGSYQLNGHTFYVLHFPTADKTWAYDLATGQWHEQTWLDNDGAEHRDRATFYAHAYGKVIGQDWETGILYELDPDTYQDNGQPILCRRGFPHVIDQMNRITHWNAVVDIQCGTIADQDADPQVNLRYSDDRGKTFSDPISQTMGATGEYGTSPQFPRLGMARDRVYEVFWAENMETALNAIYIEVEESES